MYLLVKYPVNQGIKMQIIVAENGKYLETLRLHAGTSVAVMPHGIDWTPVLTSDDPFAELLQCPLQHFPTDPLG